MSLTLLFFSGQAVRTWTWPSTPTSCSSGLFPFSTIDWQFLEYPRFSIEFHPLWSRMISALLGAWTPFSSFFFLQPLFLSPSCQLFFHFSITFTGELVFFRKKINDNVSLTLLFFSGQAVRTWTWPSTPTSCSSGLFPFSTIDWQFLEYPRFSIEFHPLWSRMISALLGAWTPFSSFLFLQPLFLSPSSTLSPSSLTSATWS